MSKKFTARLVLSFLGFTVLLALGSWAYAGGPLLLMGTTPVIWPDTEVSGGPLGLKTVDTDGTVLYRVDTDTLGPIDNAHAVALVDEIFAQYNAIPTSRKRYRNAGPILDPSTGSAVAVTKKNVGKFLDSNNPSFNNPIIFDGDGKITGGGGVLGFFGFNAVDANGVLNEGFVVLNGAVLSGRSPISVPSFLGVFTHEFGHFAGPLDHEQINGIFADNVDTQAGLPPGFSDGSAFDLFAPFTETLYPFLYPGNTITGSTLMGEGFVDSGFFIARLNMDTTNAISSLYPTNEFKNSRGSIEGEVFLQGNSANIGIQGINVVARRIDQGPYPPPAGTVAYPSAPTVDSNGVPASPPAQAATDSLATVSSAVTGLQFGFGHYRIQGLPPGHYMVEVEELDPAFLNGSSIGPLGSGNGNDFGYNGLQQVALASVELFYNGPGSSSTSAAIFTPVTVSSGQVTSGIDLFLNGFTSVLQSAAQTPGNSTKAKAQVISVPAEVSGAVSISDPGQLKVNLGGGNIEVMQNLYQFTLTGTHQVIITLDGTDETGDIDVFLFSSTVNKKKSTPKDHHLLGFSIGPTPHELISTSNAIAGQGGPLVLSAGTYYIGVTAAKGTENYKLRVFLSQ
jgi:hypothetical protein